MIKPTWRGMNELACSWGIRIYFLLSWEPNWCFFWKLHKSMTQFIVLKWTFLGISGFFGSYNLSKIL